jgi:hypothetical protein
MDMPSLPAWAVPIAQAVREALAQAATLADRAPTDAEAGLMLQWAEDLEAAARLLRAGVDK